MLTKYTLEKALNPFDDEIEIQMLDRTGYLYSPRIFYRLDHESSATIVIANEPPKDGKWVELKV